jgi:arylsulfatase
MKTKILFLTLAFGLANVIGALAADKKPNIVIIWGDDIGQANISAYSLGVMGYKTLTSIASRKRE